MFFFPTLSENFFKLYFIFRFLKAKKTDETKRGIIVRVTKQENNSSKYDTTTAGSGHCLTTFMPIDNHIYVSQ